MKSLAVSENIFNHGSHGSHGWERIGIEDGFVGSGGPLYHKSYTLLSVISA